MASALAALGSTHKFDRLFDLSIFAAITTGYVLLVGCLASGVGTSIESSEPRTEQPQICRCANQDGSEAPPDAAKADLTWTSARAVTAENCS